MTEELVMVSFRLPKSMIGRLKKRVKQERRSRSEILLRATEFYMRHAMIEVRGVSVPAMEKTA